MMRTKKIAILIITVAVVLTVYGYVGRIEFSHEPDPGGRFVVVVSHRPHHYLALPIYGWGAHSDTPAFVEIRNTSGNSCGEVPVPLAQCAEVRWDGMTAMIPSIAEWDLSGGTCYYWKENQDTRIYTKK